jgi:hypothetical protein
MMILGTNFWPLNPSKDGFIIVPTDIQSTYDRFPEILSTEVLRSATDVALDLLQKCVPGQLSEPEVHSYDERISGRGAITVQ